MHRRRPDARPLVGRGALAVALAALLGIGGACSDKAGKPYRQGESGALFGANRNDR